MAPTATFPLKVHPRGFTLTELMVALAIGALLATLGLPPLTEMMRANRIQVASAEFQTALAVARAEAIKRGTDARVSIVPNAAPSNPDDCQWQYGLTVFYSNQTPASVCPPPTDSPDTPLILQTDAVRADIAVRDNNLPRPIIYNGLGRSIDRNGALLGGRFEFKKLRADDPAATVQRADPDLSCIIISMTGRVRSLRIHAADYHGECVTVAEAIR